MRKKIFIIISIGLVSVQFSCSKSARKNTQDPPSVPVTLYKVEAENVKYYETYPGTVTALKEVGLRGEVTGFITGISFTEGSLVHKGQKLYEIDRRQYEAAFQEANDNLKIAEDNQARIQRDVDRYSVLSQQDAIARQQFDHAQTDLANAKLQVSLASEEQVKARTNLEYSQIIAPFDGTIGLSLVKIGDLITPGQTLLNTISSDDPMGVDFVINQAELRRFQQLQIVRPSPPDSIFRLALPDNTLYPFAGKIELIDRAVDPQTGTIKVRLVFPNQDRDLRPGMNCDVRVIHESAGKQVLIPFRAVQEQMGEYFTFLAENNKAKEVKVALGPRVGSDVIIQNGLEPGETIVVDGIGRIKDGSAIETGASMESSYKPMKN